MADETDILLQAMEHQWAQARQSEDQRAATTDKLLLVSLALQGYLVQRGFDKYSLPLAIIIAGLGAFGIIITEKYYERFRQHVCRVGRILERLHEINPAANVEQLERRADKKHQRRHPIMHRIRLHALWRVLHIVVLVLGLADAGVIVWLWRISKTLAVPN